MQVTCLKAVSKRSDGTMWSLHDRDLGELSVQYEIDKLSKPPTGLLFVYNPTIETLRRFMDGASAILLCTAEVADAMPSLEIFPWEIHDRKEVEAFWSRSGTGVMHEFNALNPVAGATSVLPILDITEDCEMFRDYLSRSWDGEFHTLRSLAIKLKTPHSREIALWMAIFGA